MSDSQCDDTTKTTPDTEVLMIGTTDLNALAYKAESKDRFSPYSSMAAAGRLFRQLEAGAGAWQVEVKAVDLYAAFERLGTWPPGVPVASFGPDIREKFRIAADLLLEAYPGLDVTSGVAAPAASLWEAAVRSAESRDKHPLIYSARELREREA